MILPFRWAWIDTHASSKTPFQDCERLGSKSTLPTLIGKDYCPNQFSTAPSVGPTSGIACSASQVFTRSPSGFDMIDQEGQPFWLFAAEEHLHVDYHLQHVHQDPQKSITNWS